MNAERAAAGMAIGFAISLAVTVCATVGLTFLPRVVATAANVVSGFWTIVPFVACSWCPVRFVRERRNAAQVGLFLVSLAVGFICLWVGGVSALVIVKAFHSAARG